MILYSRDLTAAHICDQFWIIEIKYRQIFILKLRQHWQLKWKCALSLNRKGLKDCIYLTLLDLWLQIYRIFYKKLQNKRSLLKGLIYCNYYAIVRLIVSLYGAIAEGLRTWMKVVAEQDGSILLLNKVLPFSFICFIC